jgi:hypothetical protein
MAREVGAEEPSPDFEGVFRKVAELPKGHPPKASAGSTLRGDRVPAGGVARLPLPRRLQHGNSAGAILSFFEQVEPVKSPGSRSTADQQAMTSTG